MQDEHTIPTQNQTTPEQAEGGQNKKTIFIGIGAFILLLIIGGSSYFLGKQSDTSDTTEITPTPTTLGSLTQPTTPTSTPTLIPTASPTSTPSPTGTTTPTPKIQTMTLSASSDLDGYRASSGAGNSDTDIRAGRDKFLVRRGFLSFDITSLSEDITISEVSLRIYQYKTVGDPYGIGGQLKIDHLDYGNSLNNEDYSLAALLASFATVTENDVVEWKDVVVTDQVKDDLDESRERSQFRIHFVTENTGEDETGDFAHFESAEDTGGTGNTPQLVIKYY